MAKSTILCLSLPIIFFKICSAQIEDKVIVVNSYNASNEMIEDAEDILKTSLREASYPCDSLGEHFEGKYGEGSNWHCVVCTSYRIHATTSIELKVGVGSSNYLLFATTKL